MSIPISRPGRGVDLSDTTRNRCLASLGLVIITSRTAGNWVVLEPRCTRTIVADRYRARELRAKNSQTIISIPSSSPSGERYPMSESHGRLWRGENIRGARKFFVVNRSDLFLRWGDFFFFFFLGSVFFTSYIWLG